MSSRFLFFLLAVVLVLSSCLERTNHGASLGTTTVQADSRIELIECRIIKGNYLVLLRDKKTGVDYMSFNHGLIRLESPSP